MTKQAKQKNLLIAGLLAIVLIMAVGYAAFATQLNINGTANISNTWCVGFKNTNTSTYVATPGKQGATTPTGSISFSGDTCSTNYQTNASLSANFKQPGDKIVYTLTIGNKSTLTAKIKSIKVENQNVTSNTTITKGNIKYTVEMPETTTLAVDAETTMKVTAEFQNDTDINKYTTGETQTISVEINAEQDDGTGGFTPTAAKYTGAIYRWSTTTAQNGNSIVPVSGTKWCDIETSSGDQFDCFDTENECNKFIKYVNDNGIGFNIYCSNLINAFDTFKYESSCHHSNFPYNISKYDKTKCPNAESLFRRVAWFSLSASLKKKHLKYIVKKLEEYKNEF